MEDEKIFTKEDVSVLISVLKNRVEILKKIINVSNEIVKNNSTSRLDIVKESIREDEKELKSIKLLILKLQNLL